jgi:1-acyl-sn-glycerol-3-phosphate acyltransferase
LGATGTKLDRKTAVEAQTLAVVRQLLVELGGARGLEELTARRSAAHLERELGLGSLERVELMLRLGDACGVRLPDRVVAEADTVQDLIDAILRNGNPAGGESRANSAAPVAATITTSLPSPAVRPELEREIRRAETLTEVLRLRGRGEPARMHIQIYEENGDLRAITFGELYERATAVAEELRSRGLEPGQTAAIMLPTCSEFFWTFAGILLAGGIPVPIYPPFRADRIAEYATRQANILRNAEARFLITWRQAEGLAKLLQPRVPTLREVLNAQRLASPPVVADAPPTSTWRAVEHLTHRGRGEDIAFLQYTSGSTGDPKGVVLTHANLLSNIRSIVGGIDIKHGDACVSWLPLYHDMGLIGAWFVPLFTGIPLVVMSPLAFLSRPERWLRAIDRHRATISPAPNFAYELCVRKIPEKDLQGLDLSTWRAATNGAEPVRAETLERFAARFAPYGFRREAIAPVYGLAEATLAVSAPKMGTGFSVDRIQRAEFESAGRAIPAASGDAGALEFVSAGKPVPDVQVRIVDAEGRELGERMEGRLWFTGPAATSGYYRNPTATQALIQEGGWLDSGDLAYWANGDIYITGRAKDVIIKAGRNIYPHEVEEIAGRVSGVRTGCVVAFGSPDERSGTERLVIAAEVRDRSDSARITDEITRAVDDAMGMPPDVIELLPPQSIPKTSSGKLRRSETRRLYVEGKLGKKVQPAWVQVARLAARGAAPRAWGGVKHGAVAAVEWVYGAYALAVLSMGMLLVWLAVSLAPDQRRAARRTHAGARWMLRLAGISIRMEERELLDSLAKTGPWIFAPNHSSYIDILVTLAVLPDDIRFVAKGESISMPIVGKIIRRSGQFVFDRGDPEARIRQSAEVDAALRHGESVGIYPEGTFTAMTGIRPFQLGAFKAAVDTQRPICPVAVRGARQILRDKTYLPRRGSITVTYGPLVWPDASAGDDWHEIVRLRDATREIIAEHAGEPLL